MGQELGSSLDGWFWLKISHRVAILMSAKAAECASRVPSLMCLAAVRMPEFLALFTSSQGCLCVLLTWQLAFSTMQDSGESNMGATISFTTWRRKSPLFSLGYMNQFYFVWGNHIRLRMPGGRDHWGPPSWRLITPTIRFWRLQIHSVALTAITKFHRPDGSN